jgi:Leucine-rich repeat (LRR) protein
VLVSIAVSAICIACSIVLIRRIRRQDSQLQLDNLDLNKPLLKKKVERLDLSNTHQTSIDRSLFAGYEETFIEFLGLKYKKIKYIAPDTFSGMTNLKQLDLSNNEIESLPTNTFSQLKQLEVLDLHKNEITEVKGESLSGLVCLKTLDLSENRITKIPVNTFSALKKLEELNLLGNKGLSEIIKNELAVLDLKSLKVPEKLKLINNPPTPTPQVDTGDINGELGVPSNMYSFDRKH